MNPDTITTGEVVSASLRSVDFGYGMLICCLIIGFIIGLMGVNNQCTQNLTGCIPKLIMVVIVLVILMTLISFFQLPYDPDMEYGKQWQVWILIVSIAILIILGLIVFFNSRINGYANTADTTYQ